MSRLYQKLLIIACCILAQESVVAQEGQPQFFILPLRTHNIESDTRSLLQKNIQNEMTKLREALLTTPTPLSDSSLHKTLNSQRMSQEIWTNKNTSPNQKGPKWAVEPIWCHLIDRDVLFLQFVDVKLGTLISSHHTVFLRSNKKNLKERIPALQEAWEGLHEKILQPLRQRGRSISYEPSALHIQVMSLRQSDWKNVSPPECTIMLAEERLAQRYLIVRQHGLEPILHIRRSLNITDKLRRPTRIVQLGFSDSSLVDPNASSWSFTVQHRLAEGVFAQPTPYATPELPLQLNERNHALELLMHPSLIKELEEEERMLLLADRPKVVHKYGAWVYLDKGRAWGLKMRDRLVATGQPEEIQGHVVRYFGPEAKLRDAKNRLIHEGAIVYIRKGQNKVRIGESFFFDPKTYPAPWR